MPVVHAMSGRHHQVIHRQLPTISLMGKSLAALDNFPFFALLNVEGCFVEFGQVVGLLFGLVPVRVNTSSQKFVMNFVRFMLNSKFGPLLIAHQALVTLSPFYRNQNVTGSIFQICTAIGYCSTSKKRRQHR